MCKECYNSYILTANIVYKFYEVLFSCLKKTRTVQQPFLLAKMHMHTEKKTFSLCPFATEVLDWHQKRLSQANQETRRVNFLKGGMESLTFRREKNISTRIYSLCFLLPQVFSLRYVNHISSVCVFLPRLKKATEKTHKLFRFPLARRHHATNVGKIMLISQCYFLLGLVYFL